MTWRGYLAFCIMIAWFVFVFIPGMVTKHPFLVMGSWFLAMWTFRKLIKAEEA